MHQVLDPFIEPGGEWLTVGDGRFGSDAQYIISKGANAHASDISATLLKIASDKGLIGSYSAQNAEALSFEDDSFDYVYCKESFHHFPRPYIALNEMFRVARKAVILTEPRDVDIDRGRFSRIIEWANRLRGKHSYHEFEEVGNFIYRLSQHELEKFMLGMHYRHIAFKPMNDAYFPDDTTGTKTLRKIRLFDALHRLGVRKSMLLNAALFKTPPSTSPDGWVYKVLPQNPYL